MKDAFDMLVEAIKDFKRSIIIMGILLILSLMVFIFYLGTLVGGK